MSKKTVYRNSITGQFVKKEYARKHPSTAEKEVVSPPRIKKPSQTGGTGPRKK